MKLKKTLLDILTIIAIVVLPHAELLPFFGYSIPILLLTWFALRYSKEGFSDIGFRLKAFPLNAIWVGLLVAVLTLAFLQLVFHPVLELFITPDYDDQGLTETIKGGKMQLLLMIVMGWLIGGVYEEIVFHGFLFTRLEKLINGKYATALSFVITSILFGIYHTQLGTSGVLNALAGGAVYLGLFVFFKRNLWYSIVCHGCYNTMVMVLIYLGYL